MISKHQMMTVAELSQELRLGKSTIWRLVKIGKFPKPVKIAGSTRWRRADIEAFIHTTE